MRTKGTKIATWQKRLVHEAVAVPEPSTAASLAILSRRLRGRTA